ncbi:MAG: response regulator [Anaerolineales bacterium]|nr:response regulator [Anaerolineales bacterium]
MLINGTNTKIIIISNDLASTESLEIALSQHNFTLHKVGSCHEVSNMAQKIDPDVIIIDLFSPQGSGLEICQDYRTFSQAPILVLFTGNKPGIVEKILNAGADECITKPASTKILVARLKTLARRYREEKRIEHLLNEDVLSGGQQSQFRCHP